MPDTPAIATPSQSYPWWILPSMGMVGESIFVVGLVLSYHLENPTLFNVALGAAIGQAQMVISYFFGSSKSSQDKDASMAADSAKKTEALAVSVPPPPMVTTTTVDPGPPPTATTTTGPAPAEPTEPARAQGPIQPSPG